MSYAAIMLSSIFQAQVEQTRNFRQKYREKTGWIRRQKSVLNWNAVQMTEIMITKWKTGAD